MKRVAILFSITLFISCAGVSVDSELTDANESDSISDDTSETDTLASTLSMSSSEDLIGFGFANQEGNQIKLLQGEKNEETTSFTQAIGENGKLTPISYLSYSPEGENNTNRQTPYNFENEEGHLFKVDGAVNAWDAQVLFTDEFLVDRELILPTNEKPQQLSDKNIKQIELQQNGWKVESSEAVAVYSNGMRSHFVKYAQKGDSVLGSFVMQTAENEFGFYNFPAIYNEISTWRVDDGGVFSYDLFKVLGLFKRGDVTEIFTHWMGAEGNNVFYLVLNEAGTFEQKKSGYLYAAPL